MWDITLLKEDDVVFNQTMENETILSSPLANTNTIVASTPICNTSEKCTDNDETLKYNMIRAASASDITLLSKPPFEISIQSEPDLSMKHNNKENDKDEFLKPEIIKSKRLSKLRSTNRKVLGSYN